jgi:hypothetical protein
MATEKQHRGNEEEEHGEDGARKETKCMKIR